MRCQLHTTTAVVTATAAKMANTAKNEPFAAGLTAGLTPGPPAGATCGLTAGLTCARAETPGAAAAEDKPEAETSCTTPQNSQVMVRALTGASGSGLPQPSHRRAWTDIARV